MAISDLSYMHAAGDGGPRTRTQVVVIHATDNTAPATGEAAYATRRPDRTSAHFYVDDTTAIRALPLGNIAYGCLYHGNQVSVQLELCGRSNAITDATMRRAAGIVAELCAQYGLPAAKVSAAQVRNGSKGVCGHSDITAAFPEDGGDHTDPGLKFDWARFIGYVQQSTPTTVATTTAAPAPAEEDSMHVQLKAGETCLFTPHTTLGGKGWLQLAAAFGDCDVRVAIHDGKSWSAGGREHLKVTDAGKHLSVALDTSAVKVTVQNSGPGLLAVDTYPDRSW